MIEVYKSSHNKERVPWEFPCFVSLNYVPKSSFEQTPIKGFSLNEKKIKTKEEQTLLKAFIEPYFHFSLSLFTTKSKIIKIW